jgi:hypothetical protein
MTQPPEIRGAVAEYWPVAVTNLSSAMSPSGLVNIRFVNDDPAPLVRVVTILPATSTSEALVVVIVPELLELPLPLAPSPTSKGLDTASPLYSRTRMSG